MDLKAQVEKLSDAHLVQALSILRKKENEVLSDMLLHLSEIDRRESYRDLGFSSLFTYMRESLGYSEGGAQRRILAARVLRANPELYTKIRAGAVSLCAVVEIAKVREAEVQRALLTQAEGQSKREVEKLVAAVLPPELPKRERVRARAVAVAVAAPLPTPLFGSEPVRTNIGHHSPPPVAVVYGVSLELDAETFALLAEAKALTGGKNADVIRKALKKFVDRHSPVKREERRGKRKAAATKKAAKTVTAPAPKAAAGSETKTITVRRHIPAPLRDRAIVRDEGRCTFVGPDGRRCSETKHLELDHIYPFSLGGRHEEGNLRVLCRAHNQLMAERVFGREKIVAARRRV